MPTRIDQLQANDKLLLKLNKLFRINDDRYLRHQIASKGGRGTITEVIATLLNHSEVLGHKCLYVQYTDRQRVSNKSGKAHIPYYTIKHLWRYTGQVTTNQVQNRQPSEDRTIVSSYTEWPYAAWQFPPGEIYSEKIILRWAK